MTSAAQFSLEEENFYKDIQDLVKKGSQNEKELSTFLQRYMDLLARADLDEETFIINFTKAALILEASAKVYGTKVDRLWITLEQVLEALKVRGKAQNNKKKGENDEEVEDVDGEVPADDAEPLKKLPNPKRRRKLGEGLTSPDDFLEIDNISGLLSKNMNEQECAIDVKIKFHEQIPNLFIRNKSDRKRIDVCLVQTTDDRDDSRLRDWTVSAENMLVKDIYLAQCLDGPEVPVAMSMSVSVSVLGNDGDFPVARDNASEANSLLNSDNELMENDLPYQDDAEGDFEALRSDNVPDDSNNNVENIENVENVENIENIENLENLENVPDAGIRDALERIKNEKSISEECRNQIMEVLNRSHEVDVGKFPNLLLKRIESYLIDVNEVFWNSVRFQDVIPSRKMRVKKTNKTPCKLCTQRASHAKKGKRCKIFDKNPCLDTYFSPLAQPGVSEPPFGILPGEELHNIYKIEVKLVERLGKIDNNKNMYEAYHPENSDDEEESFIGFDGVENRLLRNEPSNDDNDFGEGIDCPDLDDGMNIDPIESEDAQLPLPTTENSVHIAESRPADACSISSDPAFETSRMEYQEIISGELRNQEAAKSKFEKSKELGIKIANWHASMTKKLEASQKKGALNVDRLAVKVLESFPPCSSSGEKPVMSFRSLVEGLPKGDISRYFFACLQLTNERNVDIIKTGNNPLSPDTIVIKQLRTTRVRHELDEYSNSTSPKKDDRSSGASSKRKRNSDSESSTDSATGPSQRKVTKSNEKSERSEQRKRRSKSPEKKSGKKRKEH